ncbi:MAG: HIT domain-containing protein [Chloroflexi bacterium]|nr:HIT domain-containing protein [Chloroflexota bacterium]
MSASGDAPCVFCAIVAGTAPASVVYSDEDVLAFLDLEQTNPGHVLVIPRAHYARLRELPQEVAARLFPVAQRIAAALYRSGLRCEGTNIFVADGEAAGQDVFHLHVHILPRFMGDPFEDVVGAHAEPPPVTPAREELDELARTVRVALA